MELVLENMWVVWIAIGIVALVIEMSTAALVSIWFVPAAVLTCLFSLVVESIFAQIVVFVILSAIAMVISRKVYKKYIKKDKDEIGADSKMMGKIVKVVEDTDANSGQVLVGDIYWKARSENGEIILKDEQAKIVSVDGTTLVINKY